MLPFREKQPKKRESHILFLNITSSPTPLHICKTKKNDKSSLYVFIIPFLTILLFLPSLDAFLLPVE